MVRIVTKLDEVFWIRRNKFITPTYIHNKPRGTSKTVKKNLVIQVWSNETYLQNRLQNLPLILQTLFLTKSFFQNKFSEPVSYETYVLYRIITKFWGLDRFQLPASCRAITMRQLTSNHEVRRNSWHLFDRFCRLEGWIEWFQTKLLHSIPRYQVGIRINYGPRH